MSVVHVKLNLTVQNGPGVTATFQIALLKDGAVQNTVLVNGGNPLAPNMSVVVTAGPFNVDIPAGVVAEIKVQIDALSPAKSNLASISKKVSGPLFSIGQRVHLKFPSCSPQPNFFGIIRNVNNYQLGSSASQDTTVWGAEYEIAFTDPRIDPLRVFQEFCLEPA